MKNSQKILIAILVLLIIAVTALVFSVKTKEPEKNFADNVSTTILSGDNEQEKSENNSDVSSDNETTLNSAEKSTTDKSEQNVKPTTSKKADTNKGQTSSKTYDLTDASLMQSQKISFGELKLYSAKSNGKSIYLFVLEQDNKKFYKEIPGEYIIENIYYANVDGRFGDEIIVKANTGKNTEPAKYENYVLKITSDGFTSLISSADFRKFTSGFSAKVKSDNTIEISNKITGYKTTISAKNDGKFKLSDSFQYIEPKDVDDDGLYEILCSQYAYFGTNPERAGSAQTILKYNLEKKQFEVVDAVFYAS